MRRIHYRQAATLFAFTGMWFVFGLVMLWTPIPGALGIGTPMLIAWLLLFLAILAISGASLTLAAVNGLFPPRDTRASRRAAQRAELRSAAPDAEEDTTAWTAPLPNRGVPRPTGTSTTPVRPRSARRGS